MPRPVPDRPAAGRGRAVDRQVPGWAAPGQLLGCQGGRTVAHRPAHGDQAWPPLVPVGASLRVAPPVRTLHPYDAIRTQMLTDECRKQARSPLPSDRGLRYVGTQVLPAGHQDQRYCCGCNRKQRDQAGGLSPNSSGRLPYLGDQATKRAASLIFHRLPPFVPSAVCLSRLADDYDILVLPAPGVQSWRA
jgi:hypothetical protein